MPAPTQRTVDYKAYERWRTESLSRSWSAFSDAHVHGRDVLDFGCGDGQLSFFLADHKAPRALTGVDVSAEAIERARRVLASRSESAPNEGAARVEFVLGSVGGLPFDEASFDTIVAFDCLEHVMAPLPIMKDWRRVLKPGGSVLIEWFPFKGPWGPHMESLIPIPWAHVLFGEKAMFRAAERIYDAPWFHPRHWDLEPDGSKKPNKWRAWSTFAEQAYVNELTIPQFRQFADEAGLQISRLDVHSFGGSSARRRIGKTLMAMPLIGEYFVSYAIVELKRPN